MKQKLLIILLFYIGIVSCSSDSDSPLEPSFTANPVELSYVNATSAEIEWGTTISNGNKDYAITYDIFLNDELLISKQSTIGYIFENLSPKTKYTGKVIIKDTNDKTETLNFEFETSASALTAFETNVSEITLNSAKLSWTSSSTQDQSDISYDIYINTELTAENISTNEFLLESLDKFTSYTVKIIAKSESANEPISSETTFTTMGSPPSDFPLTQTEVTSCYAIIAWDKVTVEDGSDFYFNLYLNGNLYADNLTSELKDLTLENLIPETEYVLTVEVIASNETSKEETITFTTEATTMVSDFEISLLDMTTKSVLVDWTDSYLEDGSRAEYHLYLDGEKVHGENTFLTTSSYRLENLNPNTNYTVRVVSEAPKTAGCGDQIKAQEITFSTLPVYATHPTLAIEKATLYTLDSQYFPGQLNVKFNNSMDAVEITDFFVADREINSFVNYTSSISSEKLDIGHYTAVTQEKKGFVLIKDGGETYQLNFDITVESN